MPNNVDSVFRVLTQEESLNWLRNVQPGRIVVRRSEDIDIFPVNFVVDDGKVYFRTAEGSKLFSINLNQDVLFQADSVEENTAWSVVVKGNAEILQNRDAINHAETLDLRPWAPTLKYHWVQITPNEITGREFEIGEEPERF